LLCVLLLGFLQVSASGSVPVAAFVALGDTRTPARLSIVAFIAGVVLKSLCFLWTGLAGLALATSVYYLGNLVVVTLFLERRLNGAAAGRRA
jgi:peptidoglycan biosynthesis protein MviN/MurJ (putative lipid II flippase)